jgi:hypothetical protein
VGRGWWVGPVARLSWHSAGEGPHSWRHSGLYALLLHLLLALLEFLQELFRGLYLLLPVLLLLVVGGRLVVGLISLVGLIGRIVRGILTFDDDGISAGGWGHRGGHRRHGTGINRLIVGGCLFARLRRDLA